MAEFGADDLYKGFWVDYSVDAPYLLSPRVLLTDKGADILIILLTLWIALWEAHYWRLLRKTLVLLRDTIKLNDDPEIWVILQEARVSVEAAIEIIKKFRNLRPLSAILAILFCMMTLAGIVTVGVAVPFIYLNNDVLSNSPSCAMCRPNGSTTVMEKVESEYRDCYEADPSLQECNRFPDKNFYANFTENVECPFANKTVCLMGNNSAIGFDTGYLDSLSLGIASHNRPIFRRRQVCAPVISDGWSVQEIDKTTSYITIRYNYGRRIDENNDSTNTQVRSLPQENIFSPTGYLVKTRSTISGQFEPDPAFKSSMGHVFLAFFNTFNVQYPTNSSDPLFPAQNRTTCYSNSSKTCYTNALLQASVLGCTEFAEVCSPAMDKCFDVWDPNTLTEIKSSTWPGAEEAYLLSFALGYSDLANTLSTRHGLLLDVTRRIVGNRMSQPLDKDQWILEVKRLFEMGMLRTKMEMLYAVRGMRAKEQGCADDLLPESFHGVCQKFKFKAEGHKNLSFIGVLCAVLLPVFLGWEMRKKAPVEWVVGGVCKMFGWSCRWAFAKIWGLRPSARRVHIA